MKRSYTIVLLIVITLTTFASDSLNVRYIGRALNDTTCFAVKDVYVQGNYAYCACDRDGLIILDISDPSHPIEVSRLDTPGFAEAVWVRDTLAFIADWNGGLRIIDVSNPVAPAEIGTTYVGEMAVDVAVRGEYAYVGTRGSGMKVIDISDPSSSYCLVIPTFSTSQVVRNIHFSGDYAFITGNPYVTGSIWVVDISDPPTTYQVEHHGFEDIIYSSALTDSFAFFGTFLGIAVFSRSTTGWYLEYVTSYEIGSEGSWVKGVVARPPYLFAACAYNGLQIYDITDPTASLPCVGYFDTEYRSHAVFLKDTLAFVANMEGGLYILDITSFPDAITESRLPERSEIRIYPNPFNATCNISWSGRIEIFDISGRLIDEINAPCMWRPDEKTASGVYLVKVKGGEECKKLVLLR